MSSSPQKSSQNSAPFAASRSPRRHPSASSPTPSYDDDLPSVAESFVTCFSDVDSLRAASSQGSIFDEGFDESDDDSSIDGDSSDGNTRVDWRRNSLIAATRSASQRRAAASDYRELREATTMDVTTDQNGKLKRICNLDGMEFGRQYLSVLFCSIGEVMECGSSDSVRD